MNCPHCNVPNPDDARFCAACGKATSATEPVSHPGLKPSVELVGKEIAGRYRVLAKLGEGGMGAVYKAEQISLKRTCAVKLLRAEVASTELMLRRFDAEAKAVASLSHPNTVNIYDFGQDTDGAFFIAMEFVEGKSLREVIHTEAPLPIRRALSIAAQVASSLSDAHSHNIVHRDLKPDNVMLQTRGRQKDVARVLDFGIAKLRDEGRATQAAMTQAGDMLGTPQYMAPEQIRAEQIDGRTDVYALGCMIYEMITGRMPFEGATVLAILSKHLTENPIAPSQRRPDLQIPPHIDQLVMSAVAKDRNQRPPTMEALGEQIAALLAQYPSESGQGTAQVSVPMSAVQGIVGPSTYPHPQPAPASYPYPTPPPPPTGPAPGQIYNPYPAPPPPPMPQRSGGGNKTLLIAVIAALVLIAGGVGIFVATRKSDAPVVATADAGTEKPEKPDDKPVVDPVKPDKPEPDKPTKPEDDEDADDPGTATGPDPWDDPAGGTAATGADFNAQMIAKMTEYKTAICACKTMQCVTKPTESYGKWFASLGAKLATLDIATTQQVAAISSEISQCSIRIANATQKPADPNAEVDALADRACACRNAACSKRVLADMVALARKYKNKDEGDEARAAASAERLVKCAIATGVSEADLQSVFQQLQNM